MSEQHKTATFATVTRADVDRAIQRAHQLRSEETARMFRAVGKRMRDAFRR